jgi:hypothetical protein
LLALGLVAACSRAPEPSAQRAVATRAPVPVPPAIASIDIDDTWGGLGIRTDVHVRLVPVGDAFERQGSVRTYIDEKPLATATVPRLVVEAFVVAALAPPTAREDALAKMTGETWLADHAFPGYVYVLQRDGLQCESNAQALFEARYSDAAGVRAALGKYFDSRHTDDYPRSEVTIEFKDGSSRMLSSESQSAWMLPWKTADGDTWDPALAHALGALLPPEAPNVRSLTLAQEKVLAEAVRNEIDIDAWESACRGLPAP